jgi:hypothetical protein
LPKAIYVHNLNSKSASATHWLTRRAQKSFLSTTNWRNSWMNTSKRRASAPSQVLLCSLPPWERPASYRSGRSCAPTRRTCSSDGSNKRGCRLTIRLTHSVRPASRTFWKMTGPLKPLNESPATPTVGPRNSMIAVDRRFCSRIWREFGIDTAGRFQLKVYNDPEISPVLLDTVELLNGIHIPDCACCLDTAVSRRTERLLRQKRLSMELGRLWREPTTT